MTGFMSTAPVPTEPGQMNQGTLARDNQPSDSEPATTNCSPVSKFGFHWKNSLKTLGAFPREFRENMVVYVLSTFQ